MADEIHLFAQQGGSTWEWYLTAWSTREKADAGIIECKQATYNACDVVQVPPVLVAALKQSKDAEIAFYEVIETIIQQVARAIVPGASWPYWTVASRRHRANDFVRRGCFDSYEVAREMAEELVVTCGHYTAQVVNAAGVEVYNSRRKGLGPRKSRRKES